MMPACPIDNTATMPDSSPASSLSLSQRADQLAQLLRQHRGLWQPRAFAQQPLPWQAHYPDLHRTLLAMPLAQSLALQSDNQALAAMLSEQLPFAEQLMRLCQLPASASPLACPTALAVGIPGRKLAQIEAFCGALAPSDAPILEWCSGKAYLGAALNAQYQCPVCSLEWDPALVAAGNQRAAKFGLALRVEQVDVLSAQAARYLQRHQHALALHACGDLHRRLLQLATERELEQLSLAPCCYHKTGDRHYQPLSQQARRHALALRREDLHTAVQETVTASQGVIEQRIRLQQMRLGFDCLQRQVFARDQYLPIPSLALSYARYDFRQFCHYLAELKQLRLPSQIDWPAFEQAGCERFQQVSALDLVRQLFRRPLELWLVLDAALLLQEHGYQVSLSEFCQRQLSPRNLLIQARRR